MNDSRAGVLTERQDATGSHLGVAEELQGYILVVRRGLRVLQNLCHLQVVLTAQHELHIVEGLLGQQRQGLSGNLHNFLALKLRNGDAFFRKQSILGLVFAHLKHRGVLECYGICHNRIYFFYYWGQK